MRISEHFGLGLRQDELDFVDVPVETDVLLFVDPYALSVTHGAWAEEATARLRGFFQLVLDEMRHGNIEKAERLLAGVSEPNDARLGYSRRAPAGASIGAGQAAQLAESLAGSRAVQSGHLSDIAECELVIPGIGRDKVSDITISVIRELLLEYTKSQCDLLGLPTRKIASGRFWDPERNRWREEYRPLPVLEGERHSRLLLVPKHTVRHDLSLSSGDYYNNHVLEYLQVEHARPGDALAEVLKNGRIRVTKTVLKQEYPASKEFLYDFTEEHPQVLARYKETKASMDRPPGNRDLDAYVGEESDWSVEPLIEELAEIPVGRAGADMYEDWVKRALAVIFYPALVQPKAQTRVNNGRKIVDITFDHRARSGTFRRLADELSMSALFIPFECKNYSEDPRNPEVDQLQGRFDSVRGRTGVVVCRNVEDRELMANRCNDVTRQGNGVVLWLDDSDLVALLRTSLDTRIHWDLVDERARLILER